MNAPENPSPAVVLDELLRQRFSCRAYRPDPVPRPIIEAALATALRTPSWCNTQPWEIVVLSGAPLQALTQDLYQAVAGGEPPAPQYPFPESYVGEYRERRKVCGVQLYQALGIGRDDRVRAREQSLENYRGFGAPHVALLSCDASLGFYGGVDCGLFLMSFLTALRSHGIDSIAQAALASHPDVVSRHVTLGPDRRLLCGVSFGYGDPSHPVNAYRTARVGLADAVRFLE